MGELFFEEETYAIRGAVFEVHREMGSGFLEAVYQECMEKELGKQDIPFEPQKELSILYKGETLEQIYKPDMICYGEILVELKSVKSLRPEHDAQVLNHLKATGLRLGLLVNFGTHPKATIKRIIL
jgi:GxxExxY protein